MRPGVIRFTHEVEENCKLPFLDVMVSRVEDGYPSKFLRQPRPQKSQDPHPAPLKTVCIPSL